MINLDKVQLIDILPSILRKDKTMAAIARVLQKYLDENYEYIKRLNILPNIDNIQNEELIDHLAYQFHVDFYNQDISLEKKKELVKRSIYHHRKKGTKEAVEDLLSKAFDVSTIKEWFEYGGDPYFFRIHTKDTLENEQKYINTIKALNTVKNTRSWLEKIVVERNLTHNIYYGITNRQLKINAYFPYPLEDIKTFHPITIGMASRRAKSSNYSMNSIEDFKVNNKVFFTGIYKIIKEIKMEVDHV